MSSGRKAILWWAALAFLAVGSGAFVWMWRVQQGLMTLSEAAFIERVAKAADKGPGVIEKSELNPLIRRVTAWVASPSSPQEVSDIANLINALSVALLVALFAALLRRLVPWWLALAGGIVWLTLPLSMGQSGLGGAGWSSAFFLMGPSLMLSLGMAQESWGRRALVASVAGLTAGLGVLAHPLAAWVAVSLLLTLFMTRKGGEPRPGQVSLPPMGVELGALLTGLVVGFVASKGLVHAKGDGLLAFLFGYLDGPHPAFSFLGSVYRGGEMGGPPWYTTLVLFLVRTPPEWLCLGLFGAGYLAVKQWRKGGPLEAALDAGGLRTAWPLWGSCLVLLGAATLTGSPLVPAGLNLLVPISMGWTALSLVGIHHGWAWATRGSLRWQRIGRGALAVLLAGTVLHGLTASISLAPMPQAYANAFGLGPQGFLLSGNDPMAEMAIPVATLNLLQEEGLNELIISPSAKSAQRLLQAFEPTRKFKARDGGALPLLFLHAPASPRTALQSTQLEGREPKWIQEVAGVSLWSLYPR